MPKGEPEKLSKLELTYKGLFDFSTVYRLIHNYLVNAGYKSTAEPEGEDFEVSYLEKGDEGVNYIIKWKAQKEASNYVKYYIDINILGRNVKKQEILIDGKKVTVDNGEIQVGLEGSFETDYKGEGEKHWL